MRRARALPIPLSISFVLALAACDFFPDLPCEDDVNCPAPKLCCDETCVEPEVLDEIQAEVDAGEIDDADVELLEELGCLPRE